MDHKPADFFVGVVEFFSVLLPGAIVVEVLRPAVAPHLFGRTAFLPVLASESEGWIAFLVAAYLIGSILFMIGAFLDSFAYDHVRRMLVPLEEDGLYQHATALKVHVLGTDGADALNTFQWAKATLVLLSPSATSEIQHYEADSKFFRSLTIAVYAVLLVGLTHREPGMGGIMRWIALGLAVLLPIWLVLAAKRELSPRVVVLGGAGVVLAVIVASAIGRDWESATLAFVLVLVLWRYAERRWKSTAGAYTYAALLYEQAAPEGPARAPEGANLGGAGMLARSSARRSR